MSIPVLSVAAMRDWEERSWSQGIDPWDVIAQVGKKLAARYLSSSQVGDSLLLLAGPGHNGDDVRAMVPWLFQRRVELLSLNGKPDDLPRLEAHLSQGPNAVIEGLFGIGLNRPLEGAWASIVEALNRFSGPVISVDVPSGLASTGDGIIGPVVQARETWTIGALKETLLKTCAGAVTGRLVLMKDVGLSALEPHLSELHAYDPHDAVGFPPPRPAHAHKGSQGWVGILGGGAGYHGAAVLAARGAASAQPGLIRLWVPPSVYDPVASRLEHVMVETWAGEDSLPEKLTCLVAGPGMASKEWTQETFDTVADAWLNRPIAMVVDASALGRLPAAAAPRIQSHGGPSSDHTSSGRGSSHAGLHGGRGGNRSTTGPPRPFRSLWGLLGRPEGPPYARGAGSGPRDASPKWQSLPRAGRCRRRAGRVAGRLAEPTCLTDRCTTHPALWRLAPWSGSRYA